MSSASYELEVCGSALNAPVRGLQFSPSIHRRFATLDADSPPESFKIQAGSKSVTGRVQPEPSETVSSLQALVNPRPKRAGGSFFRIFSGFFFVFL